MMAVAYLLESRWSRIGRWVIAALVVCGLHAGGLVLVLIHHPEEAWDDPAGGVNVDMVAPPAPMPIKSDEMAAIGPEAEQGKEAAEEAKKVVQKVEKDEPIVEPSPAPNPEVVLPKPRPEEKEQPKEEAQEAVEKRVAQEEGDVVKRAPPPVEAQPASAGVKSDGLSPTLKRMQAAWEQRMGKHLERYRRYPESARKLGLKGSPTVRFFLDREGQVTLAEVTESSGSPILDQEALATVRRASPWPVPPSDVPDRYLENFVRIEFRIK
jgi:periplasmic protein TonB